MFYEMVCRMDRIAGMRVFENDFICELKFVRWARTHRKKRIREKWKKRYGPIMACKGVAYKINKIGLMVCPCMMKKMQEALR